MKTSLVIVALVTFASTASAQANSVVVAPFDSITGAKSNKLAPLGAQVSAGVARVPGFSVVPWRQVKKAVRKSKRSELKSCDGEAACLAELGKLVGATRVIAGDVSELDSGAIVYLKVVDVATAAERGSTTVVFGEDKALNKTESAGAAYRLLAPNLYRGRLKVNMTVAGARIQVDGRQMAVSPAKAITLTVGTHALRVTHDQYRDFVRFVDIRFHIELPLDVELQRYDVISDEMREKAKAHEAVKTKSGPVLMEPAPWYRNWWAVGSFGVVVAAATAIIVVNVAEGIQSDQEEIVR